MDNILYVAAAGSGKTTLLVNKALDLTNSSILITTYTNVNCQSIKEKIIELKGFIPKNITCQTWTRFLLYDGVRPYQGVVHPKRISGIVEVSGAGLRGIRRDDMRYYLNKDSKIYTNKISDFTIYIEEKNPGKIFNRIAKIYDYIFIDEVQDLVGYDLEVLRLLIKYGVKLIMAGDPRQVTYFTHHSRKHKKYRGKNIITYFNDNLENDVVIDKVTLKHSYRNNQKICNYATKIAGDEVGVVSRQNSPVNHQGVFIVHTRHLEEYRKKYSPVQLRYNKKTRALDDNPVYNFGESKGLEFDRVLIYPTKTMVEWMIEEKTLTEQTQALFYVAVTRARHSVGIVCKDDEVFNQLSLLAEDVDIYYPDGF